MSECKADVRDVRLANIETYQDTDLARLWIHDLPY